MWPTLLYRVKVYSNENPPLERATLTNRPQLWSFWEAQLQVLCTSEVRNFKLYFTEGYYKFALHIDGHSWGSCAPPATLWSITHNDTLPFRVLCVVRTSLLLLAPVCALLFVQLFASRRLSCCRHTTWAVFYGWMQKHLKQCQPPSLADL